MRPVRLFMMTYIDRHVKTVGGVWCWVKMMSRRIAVSENNAECNRVKVEEGDATLWFVDVVLFGVCTSTVRQSEGALGSRAAD